MTIAVTSLSGPELQLAYHLANGYCGFDYYPDVKCWKAEIKVSSLFVNSIITESSDNFVNPLFTLNLEIDSIIKLMQIENIGLRWDSDKKVELYYQALPELVATSHSLEDAFMQLRVLKEIGAELDDQAIEKMNLFKHRQVRGLPL